MVAAPEKMYNCRRGLHYFHHSVSGIALILLTLTASIVFFRYEPVELSKANEKEIWKRCVRYCTLKVNFRIVQTNNLINCSRQMIISLIPRLFFDTGLIPSEVFTNKKSYIAQLQSSKNFLLV